MLLHSDDCKVSVRNLLMQQQRLQHVFLWNSKGSGFLVNSFAGRNKLKVQKGGGREGESEGEVTGKRRV